MKTLKYLAPIYFILILSCLANNNCDEVIVGESFTIVDSTKVYLSTYFNADKIIFENSVSGEEVIFQITTAIDTTLQYLTAAVCPNAPLISSQVIGDVEVRKVQLERLSDGLVISIQHRSALNLPETPQSIEEIFILEGQLNESEQITSANSGLLVLTPTLSTPLFSIITDTLNIGNKEFYDVYEFNSANTGFEDSFLNENLSIKYSKLDGIIYLKDESTNSELIFDRTE